MNSKEGNMRAKHPRLALLVVVGLGLFWGSVDAIAEQACVSCGHAMMASATSESTCPPSEMECIFMGYRCTDYDVDGVCMTGCTLACTAACTVGGGYFAGLACSMGCGGICWELCKFCEDYDVVLYCYCPGDPVPTSIEGVEISR